ncbi:MAG: hypothetical protein IJE74_08545 [Clostridia bacterium]|nr:hypothetical protein [Clostridia bacterium]
MKRNIVVRIVAIILCVIMILGVATAALTAFAADAGVPAPDTGSQPMVWVIIAVVAAVAVIAGCIIIPKTKK